MDPSEASDDAEATLYSASFNNRQSPTERGPFFVFNQLAALKFPSGVRLGQEFVDQIGDDLEFTTTREFGTAEIASDIRTSPSTRVTGPTLGDVSRWHRATVTQTSRGITVTTEVHVVVFTLGNRVAVVGTMNVEGGASQADALNLANMVLARMQS